MSAENLRQYFIDTVLANPPNQAVENVASDSHETRDISDPYLFVDRFGELFTPNGTRIKDAMEKNSYLGRLEFRAVLDLERFTQENERGLAVWFSPPFAGIYPKSKIIISEITIDTTGRKVLFNRSVGIDVDGKDLLDLANQLEGGFRLEDPEQLRSNLLYPTNEEFVDWFSRFSLVSPEAEKINSGNDLQEKLKTYDRLATISDVLNSVPLVETDHSSQTMYAILYENAKKDGLIGSSSSSCPVLLDGSSKSEMPSPFEAISSHSSDSGEVKTLKCTCPFCKKKVTAEIKHGKIYCPNPNCLEGRKGVKYNC